MREVKRAFSLRGKNDILSGEAEATTGRKIGAVVFCR